MSSAPTAALVLVAAGPGSRLGANRPKALVELAGRSILDHALESVSNPAAAALLGAIVVVAPASHLGQVERLVARRIADGTVVAGGRERQDSVRAGLEACAGAEIVVVHDAARPFVSPVTLAAAIAAAADHGAAVAALPAVDTVKIVDDERFVASTPPRDRVWLAQTPQAFRREVLLSAHTAAGDNLSTDDAALVEAVRGRVQIVSGDPLTRKITTADDLRWAEWVLASGQWPR
jgi:2-C-methyl-D-erythritol 4-phosphate cytidylyltransferase